MAAGFCAFRTAFSRALCLLSSSLEGLVGSEGPCLEERLGGGGAEEGPSPGSLACLRRPFFAVGSPREDLMAAAILRSP